MESMSKKEKLARGSAVIKVMRVVPRPGHFLKSYVDPRKMPKTLPVNAPKGLLAEMPWLDVKRAEFTFSPKNAKSKNAYRPVESDLCDLSLPETDLNKIGLPEGDKMLKWFGYREWVNEVNPLADGNVAEHFNVLLGLLISMALDPQNENFADVEAYPTVQFLKIIKTETGQTPYNVAALISYIEFVCQKAIDEG